MARVLFDGELDVHYGFGFIHGRDDEAPDLDESRVGQTNGLLGTAAPGCLSLMFGLHTGPEPLRVEWTETAPPIDTTWEEVVEGSVDFGTTELLLAAFEEFIDIDLPVTGPHRARFNAMGMDAANEMDSRDTAESAPDRYLLQLWPAGLPADAVIRQTSDIAAYWHRVARGEAD
jgi:hypothetical protein